MHANKHKNKGFTLIEIMISLLLGLIVIGGAISIYISTIRSSTDITNSARLNYDLDSVMQLMVNDIRRSGYWGDAVAGSNAMNNNFTQATTDIQIRNIAAPTTAVNLGNCILYTYDANGDGIVDDGTANPSEYYGFRLNGVELEMRVSGTAATALSCGENVEWRNIVDENTIKVNRLQFSLSATVAEVGPPVIPALLKSSQCLNVTTGTSYATPCSLVTAANLATDAQAVEARQINIVLTGEIDNDTDVTKALTASVKVRNNRIFTQP